MFFSHRLAIGTLLYLFTAKVAASSRDDAQTCASFTLQGVNNTVVTGTTYYKAGENVTVANLANLPAFCRVELVVITNATANSSALTEVWLPQAWNGRFLTLGNGGFAGSVDFLNLGVMAVKQGFAGMATDTGHESGGFDAEWAGPHNDNAIIDNAWRAIHLSIISAKEVTKQYYGEAQHKSYYIGCSTGGRQGLKEAQEFPEDFDGVVVGSPSNWWGHILAHMARSILLTRVNTTRFISQDTWTNVIHPEVLKQCDQLDGLKDNMLNDPRRCSFRPETLTCGPGQDPSSSACLSLPQIDSLRRLYTDYYETNQTYIFGGWYPGGEIGMPMYLFTENPAPFVPEIFKYIVTNDTTWDYDRFNYDSIVEADNVLSGQFDATSPNLTSFISAPRSGKIIHYVGWGENAISAANSLHYYESVHAWMKANGGPDMDSFYRLFTVPGMEHCFGGYGPNAFGGFNQAALDMPPVADDANNNVLTALVQWVEAGTAPDTLIGTAYKNNSASEGVAFSRPLCKYPTGSVYTGGDPSQASSFKCV